MNEFWEALKVFVDTSMDMIYMTTPNYKMVYYFGDKLNKSEVPETKRLTPPQKVTLKRACAWALSDSMHPSLIQSTAHIASGSFTIERSRFFVLQAGSIPPTWAQKWKHWSKYRGGEEMVAMDLWSWRGKRSMPARRNPPKKLWVIPRREIDENDEHNVHDV